MNYQQNGKEASEKLDQEMATVPLSVKYQAVSGDKEPENEQEGDNTLIINQIKTGTHPLLIRECRSPF